MEESLKDKKYLFTNDFVFCSVLTGKPELCRELVELILEIRVSKIEFIQSQESMKQSERGKGIRLDVFAMETGAVYNLEMQTTVGKNLSKRSRYYQSMIDQTLLNQGEDYESLRKSYVVFICLSDPFGANLCRYRFRRVCLEKPELMLGDETETVFLNAAGNRDGVRKELAEFLDYLETATPKGELTDRIQKEIDSVSKSPEWRKEYMTLEMKLRDVREEGRAEGREEGRTEGREEGRAQGREEGRAEGREEGKAEERIDLLGGLVNEGILSIEAAAERAKMNVSEFTDAIKQRSTDSVTAG